MLKTFFNLRKFYACAHGRCVCTMCIEEPVEVRRGMGSLELELQAVRSNHAGARNQTQVFHKRSKCF